MQYVRVASYRICLRVRTRLIHFVHSALTPCYARIVQNVNYIIQSITKNSADRIFWSLSDYFWCRKLILCPQMEFLEWIARKVFNRFRSNFVYIFYTPLVFVWTRIIEISNLVFFIILKSHKHKVQYFHSILVHTITIDPQIKMLFRFSISDERKIFNRGRNF